MVKKILLYTKENNYSALSIMAIQICLIVKKKKKSVVERKRPFSTGFSRHTD